jgi:phosphate uptake regulator
MPKMTEKGLLNQACRNGAVMLRTVRDAFESGKLERAIAARDLAHEFITDVDDVLNPLIEALRAKAEAELRQ